MKLIDRIKIIFLNKKEKQENTTTITLYDVSDIKVPIFNELSKENQDKVIKYQKEIDIENLQNIIKYNQEISKNGEELSNLLIKYLYDLNEVIRKDDKSEYELNEININARIKNMKIVVIRDMLKDLLQESYLRTVAVELKKEEYLKKEHKFIEVFSRAARIKRNMELRSIEESITRCKITIKTLEQQINAINNAINNNNIITDKIEIYNKINNTENNIKKEIFLDKIDLIIKVYNNLDCKFSKYDEIINILKKEKILENIEKLIELIAILEIELDKYIKNNKDKIVSEYINKIEEIQNIEINHENENKILKEIKRLQVISQVFKDYIDEQYKEDIYKIKFDLLTYDINEQNDIFTKFHYVNENNKELNHYYDIINKKINDINQGISPVAKVLKEKRKLIDMIKLLNSYFKSFDGKYRYKDILIEKSLLALLLAFDNLDKFDLFFKQYTLVKDGSIIKNSIFLPTNNFEWDDYIPLETVYILYELDERPEKPLFYEIYKLYYGKVVNYTKGTQDSLKIYSLPEGIKEIKYSFTYGRHQEEDNLVQYIRYQVNGRIVKFPSSLRRIRGNIFTYCHLTGIELNEGLEYIGDNVFRGQSHVKKISFPKSVSKIKSDLFYYQNLKEIEFKDYRESKLLYYLLYYYSRYGNDSYFISLIIRSLFNSEDKIDRGSILIPNIKKILLSNKEDGTIELNYYDITKAINININKNLDLEDRIRINLSQLIEEKTGINLKKYQEEKILKK